MTESAQPLAQVNRIHLLDALRGIALLGILLMNAPIFAWPYIGNFNILVQGDTHGADYWVWWVVNVFFEGSMRAIFSMLFGAGTLLLLARLEAKDGGTAAADVYYRRILLLLGFGLVNAFLLQWAGDILYPYAVCGLFLFPFRKLSGRAYALISAGFLAICILQGTLDMFEKRDMRRKGEVAVAAMNQKKPLTKEQNKAMEEWHSYQDNQKLEKKREKAAEAIEQAHGGYLPNFSKIGHVNFGLQSGGFYYEMFWDVMLFFFLGMALYRWGVITGQASNGVYWAMLAVGYGVGLPYAMYILKVCEEIGFEYTLVWNKLWFGGYQVKRLFVSMGHLGLLILLYRSGWLSFAFKALARVGQMAFTNYLSQSLIFNTIFLGWGFGLYGTLQRHQVYYIVFAVWVFQIVFSNLWLRRYYYGPLEWVWRSLTYGVRQPFRRLG